MVRHFNKLRARIMLLSFEVAIVTVAFAAALSAFLFIARMVFLQKRERFDEYFFQKVKQHVSAINTDFMEALSFLGSHYFLIPANLLLSAYFLFIKKHRWHSIKVPAVALSSLLLMFILKQFFRRDRPINPLIEEARGYSFPSGHSFMSFTFYGLIIYLLWNAIDNKPAKWIILLMLLTLIFFIGISRIYLRVHYASDVVAGFSLGLIWLVLSISILQRIEQAKYIAQPGPIIF